MSTGMSTGPGGAPHVDTGTRGVARSPREGWPPGAVERVRQLVEQAHTGAAGVVWHDWPHVWFVRTHAVRLAGLIGADPLLVEVAALTHDLNYIAGTGRDAQPRDGLGAAPTRQAGTGVEAGRVLRHEILAGAGLPHDDIVVVNHIIGQADITTRAHTGTGPGRGCAATDQEVRLESQALSDADTLYKILPITPLFAVEFLRENRIGLADLADKILTEQRPLLQTGRLFFNPDLDARYRPWVQANLDLWSCIAEALHQSGVRELLQARPHTAALLHPQDRPDGRTTVNPVNPVNPVAPAGREDGVRPVTCPQLRAELLARLEDDQRVREPVDQHAIAEVDADNLDWLAPLIDTGGWPDAGKVGDDGAHAAWLLVQHSPPAERTRWLPLLRDAVRRGLADPRDLAYLSDRVHTDHARPQVYGTQWLALSNSEPARLQPIADPADVNILREELGLPPLDAESLAGAWTTAELAELAERRSER